jgi:hypothetical protein
VEHHQRAAEAQHVAGLEPAPAADAMLPGVRAVRRQTVVDHGPLARDSFEHGVQP